MYLCISLASTHLSVPSSLTQFDGLTLSTWQLYSQDGKGIDASKEQRQPPPWEDEFQGQRWPGLQYLGDEEKHVGCFLCFLPPHPLGRISGNTHTHFVYSYMFPYAKMPHCAFSAERSLDSAGSDSMCGEGWEEQGTCTRLVAKVWLSALLHVSFA